MKNLVLLISIGFSFFAFTSCDKGTDDYKTLKGSTWISESGTTIMTLRFVNDSISNVLTGSKDGSLSANSTAYYYRFLEDFDSMYFDVLLYHKDNDGYFEQDYFGYFINKNRLKFQLKTTGETYYFTKQ